MTEIKSIVIPNDCEDYNKLNQMTPDNMPFTRQVGLAVNAFVEKENIDSYLVDKRPDMLAPIEQWIDYLKNHPEHIGDIMRRNTQLRNILLKEQYAI